MIELTTQPIDTAAVLEQVASPLAGAVVLFLGTTRELTGDRRTSSLDYECYPEMARRKLAELDAELALLEQREDDHPKAACALLASRCFGRYLSPDWHGRPQLDAAKVKAAEKFDGKFVVISNDDTLSAEDIALEYKARTHEAPEFDR